MILFFLRLSYTTTEFFEVSQFVTETYKTLTEIQEKELYILNEDVFEKLREDSKNKILYVNEECSNFLEFSNPYKFYSHSLNYIANIKSKIDFLERILKLETNLNCIKNYINDLETFLESLKEKYDKIQVKQEEVSKFKVIGKKGIKIVESIKEQIKLYNNSLLNFNDCIIKLNNEFSKLQKSLKTDEEITFLTYKNDKYDIEKFIKESPMKEDIKDLDKIMNIIDFIENSQEILTELENINMQNALSIKEEDYKRFKAFTKTSIQNYEYYLSLKLQPKKDYFSSFQNTLEYKILELNDKLSSIKIIADKKINFIENEIATFKAQNKKDVLQKKLDEYNQNIKDDIKRISKKITLSRSRFSSKKYTKKLNKSTAKQERDNKRFTESIEQLANAYDLDFNNYFHKILAFFDWFVYQFDNFKNLRKIVYMDDLITDINDLEKFLFDKFKEEFLECEINTNDSGQIEIFETHKSSQKTTGKKETKNNKFIGYKRYFNHTYVIEYKDKIYKSKFNNILMEQINNITNKPTYLNGPNGTEFKAFCFYNKMS